MVAGDGDAGATRDDEVGAPASDAAALALVRRALRGSLDAEVLRVELIPAGLGLRRFARVWLRGGPAGSLIARLDAPEDPGGRPPDAPPEPPLEPLRALLERHGLPVPALFGEAPESGVLLLEDLGDTTLADAARGASERERLALYTEACSLVARLQRVADPGDGRVAAFSRRLDADLFAYKAELFIRWSLPERGREATPGEARAVRDAFALVARVAAQAPQRLAHRDLQSANVLVRRERPAGARLALIDLQGALLAPPEYDLVCLLRDSYLELSPAELERLRADARRELPDAPDAESFARRFDLLTLTRKGKDHARYRYAAARRGDRRFLRHLPVTVRYLKAAAARAARRDPALAPLAELMEELTEAACAP